MRQPKYCTGTYSGFFSKMKEFVSRTISDGSIDLEKYPVSRLRQLAKKLESLQKQQCTTHQRSVRGTPLQLRLIFCITREWSYPSIRQNKKKSHAKFNRSSSKLQCRNDLSHGQKIKGNHFPPSSNKLPPSGNHNQCSKCGQHST